MSGGRILLLIFGILFMLGSVPLLLGGGALLWVDIALKDDDGFFTTESYQLERNSYAIVTESAHIDIDEEWNWGWGWFGNWDLGDLVTFKVEGSNRDTSKGILIGVAEAEEPDWREYINDVEYDETIDFRIHDDKLDVEYKHHYGSLAPADPTSQTFWAASTYGTGIQKLEWKLETGTYSIVLMNQDGSRDVDVDIALGMKIPLIFGFGVGLLVGWIVALIIGTLVIIFSLRGRKRSRSKKPMHIIKRV
ncbi:MAG TPA: hypothetical protein VMX96_02730 [Dehalococcoidia bacterium]|nr:hypothetical protein [Dehalococcoidia bacterium]